MYHLVLEYLLYYASLILAKVWVIRSDSTLLLWHTFSCVHISILIYQKEYISWRLILLLSRRQRL